MTDFYVISIVYLIHPLKSAEASYTICLSRYFALVGHFFIGFLYIP